MSFLYPEEDDVLPKIDPLQRLKTQREYGDDPEEMDRTAAKASTGGLGSIVTKPKTVGTGPTPALDKVTQILGERPVQKAPNFWQKIAAAGIGAASGYVNAGGRVKIDPRAAISAVTGETGFQNADAAWKRRLEATRGQAQIEAGKASAQRQGELDAANLAHVQEQTKKLQWDQQPNAAPDFKQPALVKPGQGVWDPTLKKYTTPIPAPEPVDKQPNTIEGQAMAVLREDIPDEQKTAKLDKIVAVHNRLHPDKPITHFATDDKGNVTAVSVNPSAVANAPAGKLPLGTIGKSKTAPVASAATPWTPAQTALLGNPPTSGERNEEFLKTLSPQDQIIVKRIADYDYPLPTGSRAGLKDPSLKNIIAATMAYDKNFSVPEYANRQKIQQDYQSAKRGTTGGNIVSLGTLTGHLGTLYDMSQALQNGNTQLFNSLGNRLAKAFGRASFPNYELAKAAVSTELSTALKGQATEGDIKTWADALNGASSPEQFRGAATVPLGLMHTRFNELQSNYLRNMHKPFPMLSPEAKATFQKFGIDPSSIEGNGMPEGGPPASGGKFDVTDPTGKVHPFSSQVEAEKFKKLAGIK